MRKLRTAVLALGLVAGGLTIPATAASAASGGVITDPLLLGKIEDARANRTEGAAEPTLPVEVLGSDAAARAAIVSNGGTVTGGVQGVLVQSRLPISKVAAVAGAPGVDDVRYPRRAGYVVPPDRPTRLTATVGTGSAGEEVAITNADDWQAAGFNGSGVKVGIIDYFDLGLWYTPEIGAVPDASHTFCQDSIFPPPSTDSYCDGAHAIKSTNGDAHGVAVAEIVKDMAPGAELYVATVATTSDLQAAIAWLAQQGVTIVTRSLGSPYDGPGDGTGAIDSVVDYASSLGLTWFNSAGNDAIDQYLRRTVPTSLGANGYVDFDAGAGVDTWLRIDGLCGLLDGIRWANDWYLPAVQRTDYSIEFWEPKTDVSGNGDHWNPTSSSQVTAINVGGTGSGGNIIDASQRLGAPPLEAADLQFCPSNYYGPFQGISYIRVKRNSATTVGATPDTLEVAMAYGLTELNYYDVAYSAAKPVVDSKNLSLVSVGAVDPAAGTVIGDYSSQGPTNDGRTKPDVSAPSGLTSWVYTNDGDPDTPSSFQGTSAASPVAAGMAAVLQGAGLAAPGQATAALVKHFATDLGTPGPDNAFGTGKILLPGVPGTAPAATPAKYVPLSLPTRVLDTRSSPHVGPPELTGPYPAGAIIDVGVLGGPVPTTGVSAVVVNLTSVNTAGTGYLQAFPYLRAKAGATSTLNISTAGAPRPNFAIVPVGVDGKISVFLQAGGNVIVDVMGYYLDGQTTATEGRFVPLADPERWMDTRGLGGAPLPAVFAGTPRLANAGETIEVPAFATTALPATGVAALVVNVTAAGSSDTGYLQAVPTGAVGAVHSTVNYTAGTASANTAIVPLGTGGTISVFTSKSVNIILDVVGYITDGTVATDTFGLFQVMTPGRPYDTRVPTPNPFVANEVRTVDLDSAPISFVPTGAAGISANLTVVNPAANGYLKAYPNTEPATSSLNFAAGKTVANGAMLGLSATGTVTLKMSQGGNVIIDVNGYFLAGPG